MKTAIEVRTSERYELEGPHRNVRCIHIVEIVVGGIVFRTEAASMVHAFELALRTAKALGLELPASET